MGFFRRKDATPSLDSVRFDTTGYEARDAPAPGLRLWFSPDRDGVGLYLFALPPNLPRFQSRDEVRTFYTQQLSAAGGGVVEADVMGVAGLPVVQVITKVPQEPSGLAYIGAITIPFRDFSFVVKVQGFERGPTGAREALLLERRLAAGELERSGWDPDAAAHDAGFPDHPVARVRRVLERVRGSLVVVPAIAALPRFPLPVR